MGVPVFDDTGPPLLDRALFTLPPLGHLQDLLPVQVDRGSIEFLVEDPSQKAVVFPYTSTIDQLSGDPTYQSPTLLASPKVLFGKQGMPAPPSLLSPGKRIDIELARDVRSTAIRLGEAKMPAGVIGNR